MTGGEPKPLSADLIQEAVAELERVGLFERRPNQGQLFRYLAGRLLRGDQSAVKEYVLGVEGLGRPAGFDPKTDSIVRVEVRKLRLTLEDYFVRGEGKHSPVILQVPKGEYRLEAIRRDAGDVPEAVPGVRRVSSRIAILIAGAALLVIAASALFFHLGRKPDSAPARVQPAAVADLSSVRILAGNLTGGFTDSTGRRWEKDMFFEGGLAAPQKDTAVVNVDDQRLYQSHREGQFQYHIPLKPGVYELRLYFAEFLYGHGGPAGGGEVSRMFRIDINGKTAIDALDVVAAAPGRGVAIRKVFLNTAPAQDGKLHIGFHMLRPDKAFVNAIEVVPGLEDRMLPIRMVAAPQPATDGEGNLWEPDSFVSGGRRELRSRTIEGAPAQSLFQSERFGHFSYNLCVVPGRKYRLNLWMAEQYFGFPGASVIGRREFGVYLPGITLLKGFDPMREAGGPGRAIRRSFSGLRPDAFGVIRLQFIPERNYAMVNALELLDEGPE